MTCVAFLWLFCAGLVLSYSSLFAKTHRIYRIFANSSLSVRAYSDADVALVVVVAVIIEIVRLRNYKFALSYKIINHKTNGASEASLTFTLLHLPIQFH